MERMPTEEKMTSEGRTMTAAKEDAINSNINPLLTDLYQFSMAYAYWKTGKHNDKAVFDLFFRKNPFGGEFTIFAGLEECLKFVQNFKFTDSMIQNLKTKIICPEKFWKWLMTLDSKEVKIYAMKEGSIVFPRCPLMRIEGPLAICQLLETTLLCLVNYPSLICTNAARHRWAAGKEKDLLEFGMRRAQGPDGAMSASKYAVMGGFNGTSNVLASIKFGLACNGTHAHSFVAAFQGIDELKQRSIEGGKGDFVQLCVEKRKLLKKENTNEGELAAFISFAQAFPDRFLALIDTYDTIASGLWNFLAVSLALHDIGHKSLGVRLDSGDLAYLSKECRKEFSKIAEEHKIPYFKKFKIVASNGLSEEIIYELKRQGHEIDTFGVGTNLVTCKSTPALGCVYKLVELNGVPRIKISQDVAKVTIPGKKNPYRLYGISGEPAVDILMGADEKIPEVKKKILCLHPSETQKKAYCTPTKVESLLSCVFDGEIRIESLAVQEVQEFVWSQLQQMRCDHLRKLNPT
mmetsp:Transcript_26438/g.63801  ORF Transcript_26438/g.63801 Transcript_26438/m.63801 type:complete len:519 (+) Transcript_26438:47-1603(+)